MEQINIHSAKTHLSALIENKSIKGESFVIAKAGKPVAIVNPYNKYPKFGAMKGKIVVPEDFDRMGEDEIYHMFGGLEQRQ